MRTFVARPHARMVAATERAPPRGDAFRAAPPTQKR